MRSPRNSDLRNKALWLASSLGIACTPQPSPPTNTHVAEHPSPTPATQSEPPVKNSTIQNPPAVPTPYRRWLELLTIAGVPSVRDCARWVNDGQTTGWDCGQGFVSGSLANRFVGGESDGVGVAVGFVPKLRPGPLRTPTPAVFVDELDSLLAADAIHNARKLAQADVPSGLGHFPTHLVLLVYAQWAIEHGYTPRALQLLEKAEAFARYFSHDTSTECRDRLYKIYGEQSAPDLRPALEYCRDRDRSNFSMTSLPRLEIDLYHEAELINDRGESTRALQMMRRAESLRTPSNKPAPPGLVDGLLRRHQFLAAHQELLAANPNDLELEQAVDYWLLEALTHPYAKQSYAVQEQTLTALAGLGPKARPLLKKRLDDPTLVPWAAGRIVTIGDIAAMALEGGN